MFNHLVVFEEDKMIRKSLWMLVVLGLVMLPSACGAKHNVDVAITDLYPDIQPVGHVFVRVTNNGPNDLVNDTFTVACDALVAPLPGVYAAAPPIHTKTSISVSSKPGETQAFDTGMETDTSSFSYKVTCHLEDVKFYDSISSNDTYFENIP